MKKKLTRPQATKVSTIYVVQQLKPFQGEVIWDTLTGGFWERPTAERWVDHLAKGVRYSDAQTYRIVPISSVTLV